jgi:hypothetical protein
MITSGGIDCMQPPAKSYTERGDIAAAEPPACLGGLMAFRGYEADVSGVPPGDSGMRARSRARRPCQALRLPGPGGRGLPRARFGAAPPLGPWSLAPESCCGRARSPRLPRPGSA